GEARAKALNKLGIFELRDLVSYFPRAYEDRTRIKSISEATVGETVCVRATASTEPRLSRIRRGLDIVKVTVFDERSAMDITFFNQSYVRDAIKRGEEYIFYGKIGGSLTRPEMTNPQFEKAEAPNTAGRIVPVYRLTAGISQKIIANAVLQGLRACGDELPEYLPQGIRRKYELAQARFAYENIHFPPNAEALELARRRLIFEELFVLSCSMALIKGQRERQTCKTLEKPDINEFLGALPYSLTGAQRRAADDVLRDLTGGVRMNRLIQGDVGSGKTVVAALACWTAAKNGGQCAFMAPTEILANQHYRSLSELLEPLGVRVGLLTGGMTAKQRRDASERIALGMYDVVIGTHALISGTTVFKNLTLVVTDEQHRFGVDQRAALSQKGNGVHTLVMSATPIPRTLALIIYGDLDVSVIDELPPGRQKVETYSVGEKMRPRINAFIRRLVDEGRQVYIVCPMVEESESFDDDMKAAVDYEEKLRTEVFPDKRVALVHGKLKPKEKDAVMASFTAGDTDILVATTVIEVGVDVPNAALMVVENADRFGLSQLHQLRGRV
ncbi:MAG: ATP-dependent DNA helicase RecG, partial [Oscillospiraceae bacterium]|nr:ATP-dependent DNA helicase RecG [Oscillospiraceae bacterium]